MLLKEDQIRKIAPRIYTSNFLDEPAAIIKRNWLHILSALYPKALLSHRSALEFVPTSNGHVFLTYTYTEKVKLPGLTIQLLEGASKIEDQFNIKGKVPYKITEIAVSILKADGSVLESGNAIPNQLKWKYVATVANALVTGCKLVLVAKDRRGVVTTLEQLL